MLKLKSNQTSENQLDLFKKTMKAAEMGQKELIEKLKDTDEKQNISLKKQKNEDLFCQYGIQTVTDSSMNIDSRKQSRKVKMQKRIEKIEQFRKELEIEAEQRAELILQQQESGKTDQIQKANPFGTS